MKRLLALFTAAVLCTAAYAQNPGTVTNHAFAIGKGPGVTGYTSLLCGAGKIAIGQTTADPQCVTITGDGAISAAGVLTLGTVNSNVGSFGSTTQCVALTVNAKGLVTAASAATCTPAVGSVTGFGTGVLTALTLNIGSAGAPVLFNGALGTPSSGVIATGLTLGPVTPGFGGDATGDIYYRTAGGVLARLPIGSTGQVATVAGGLPSWATAGTGAVFTAGPANPTGTTSGTGVMMGLGSSCTITPTKTGRIQFTIMANVSLATVAGTVSVFGLEGTGTAPINGAAQTGTGFDGPRAISMPAAGSFGDIVTSGPITGLALSTAVWFDLWLQSDGTHTATALNIKCFAIEF